MSWVRTPLAAPITSLQQLQPASHLGIALGETAFLTSGTCRLPRAPKQTATLPPEHLEPQHLAPAPPHLYCGTSGWDYPTWKPGFYPADVPRRAFLPYYAANLTSVEVNYTFRSDLKSETAAAWLAATPDGFLFTFKAPQRMTHFSRLRDCDAHLANFLTTLSPIREAARLGAILFQLPPNFKANPDLLQTFLRNESLRKNTPRLAFEFRHESWFTEDTYTVLREHNAALCIADTDDLVTPDVPTADFAYYRLRHPGGYKPKQLVSFAERFSTLAPTKPAFVYLMHEEEPTGALNARAILDAANKRIAGARA